MHGQIGLVNWLTSMRFVQPGRTPRGLVLFAQKRNTLTEMSFWLYKLET